MPRYATTHSLVNTDNTTLINIEGSTAVRLHVYDIIIGARIAPADVAGSVEVVNTSTIGTGGSGLSEAPLDPADAASQATALGGTFSGEPTAGNVLLRLPHHQRNTVRWIAAPRGELVSALADADGLALLADIPSTAFIAEYTVHWWE